MQLRLWHIFCDHSSCYSKIHKWLHLSSIRAGPCRVLYQSQVTSQNRIQDRPIWGCCSKVPSFLGTRSLLYTGWEPAGEDGEGQAGTGLLVLVPTHSLRSVHLSYTICCCPKSVVCHVHLLQTFLQDRARASQRKCRFMESIPLPWFPVSQ